MNDDNVAIPSVPSWSGLDVPLLLVLFRCDVLAKGVEGVESTAWFSVSFEYKRGDGNVHTASEMRCLICGVGTCIDENGPL